MDSVFSEDAPSPIAPRARRRDVGGGMNVDGDVQRPPPVQQYAPTCNGHPYVEVGWLTRPQISKDMVPWKRVKIEIEKPLFPSDLVSGDSGQVLGAAGRSIVRPNFTHVLEIYDGTEVLFSSAAPL